MGRRSLHKPEELRTLIIDAAHRIIEQGGVAHLSARSIARVIGYAPGTLYNLYQNLDEIVLRVQVRLLEELDQKLAANMNGSSGEDAIRSFATATVRFAHRRPRLWCLLTMHNLPADTIPPAWYLAVAAAPQTRLEPVLAELMLTSDRHAVAATARTLWQAIHGIISMSTTAKHGEIDEERTLLEVEDLVETYLAGLASRHAKRSGPARTYKDRPAAAG